MGSGSPALCAEPGFSTRDKASLDIFWLRDQNVEESGISAIPGGLAQESVEDLETALEQFCEIASDLGTEVTEQKRVEE